MPATDSPAIIVARFLKANNYIETLEIFLREAGLPLDAGSASKGDLTIEKILEEKKTFDVSVSFEKLGIDDDEKGWRLPGQVVLYDCKEGRVAAERRDHTKYVVKVASWEEPDGVWIATVGWDAKVILYRLNWSTQESGAVNYHALHTPVASISVPTNPEAILFVQHPEDKNPILLLARRDSTFLYYYALPDPSNQTAAGAPLLLGRQNLAPHSNAWIAFTPSAIALCPTDPSLLAVATSAVPHMKLIIVRLLFPPLSSISTGPHLSSDIPTAPVSLLDRQDPSLPTQASQTRAALVVADRENTAILIHCTTMSPQTAYSTPALAWRPDGSGVWVNSDDGVVRGIETATGKVVGTLNGHEPGSKVRCLWAGHVGIQGDDDEVRLEEWVVSGGYVNGNCTGAGLTCTYNAIPQKKGPKGSRAKVISELRENQRQSQLVAKAQQHAFGFDSPPLSPAFSRTGGLLCMDTITSCVDYFFAHMYPTQPILHRIRVGETIGQMDTSIEAYCLVTSLCAYMMIQPNMSLPANLLPDGEMGPGASTALGNAVLQEALRVRKGYNYVESPTVWSVITSFFFFGSFFCLDKHNTAWFHLREATTLAELIGMHEEATYSTGDIAESSRTRRLYWLLFVTERAYALQRHRPLTLHATIGLPRIDEDPAETVELSGFIHLVNLFNPFDDTFVGLWNKARTGCTTEWLARLQDQLANAMPAYLESTESQAVDLRTSQQWLRTMVWQLSISHGFLSSTAADHAMSFKFPIEISRDLVSVASGFSQQAMEVHGIGLIEKLFDVACTLTDVMSCVPIEQHAFEYGPRDYLNQFLSLISTLRGGQQRYLPLLVTKINDTIPSMSGYGLPMSLPSNRIEEVYDNHSRSSDHTSSNTTPFGSPPGSSLNSRQMDFKPIDFNNNMITASENDTAFSSMTTAMQYADMTTTSPMATLYDDINNHAYSGS
ncbi:hypothetical protein B0A49_06877 [Cryomyces minteri]|uniref:Xylanolytic transcriptional activator regulatory domain-containing protein n=1 Tax=Cryomyces minteri TaxID=331657 RepID=A0A4U0X6I0_9PEZI|nr:hypothetical protein B0A49_06877 [Cryomyces minteri]